MQRLTQEMDDQTTAWPDEYGPLNLEESVRDDIAKSGVAADIIESLGVKGEGPLLPEDQASFDKTYQGIYNTTMDRRQNEGHTLATPSRHSTAA